MFNAARLYAECKKLRGLDMGLLTGQGYLHKAALRVALSFADSFTQHFLELVKTGRTGCVEICYPSSSANHWRWVSEAPHLDPRMSNPRNLKQLVFHRTGAFHEIAAVRNGLSSCVEVSLAG